MPRKKGKKKSISTDFTINDSANAPKPVSRVKKSIVPEVDPLKSWEDFENDEYGLIEETSSDGTKNLVCIKKGKNCKSEDSTDHQGIVYPEIVWYLISQFIKPEDIRTFALLNKVTYSITKREYFWKGLYLRFCKNHVRLPERLYIEKSYAVYGLRQRVIRALYISYNIFFRKIIEHAASVCSPHLLVKRRCVNVWYKKARANWIIFFKLKRQCMQPRVAIDKINIIQELGRIDANPDEDCQVLQVTCQTLNEVPPLMGMALSFVNVSLSQGFTHQRLHLGFNASLYISKNIVPECSVIIDNVLNMAVYDWWHPLYPHSEDILPSLMRDEELLPVLRKDFFTLSDE